MTLSVADFTLITCASFAAGTINALAGGGTLISFPALVAVGVPSLSANITNTVALCPGYLSGTMAQRDDLRPQFAKTKRLALISLIGGLFGSVLLELTPARAFRVAVPWLIILSCVLLLAQDRIRDWLGRGTDVQRPLTSGVCSTASNGAPNRPTTALAGTVLASSVYGGFFGAGLGIMLLASLGLFTDDSLVQVNAVKQALSLVINACAAVVFALTGNVRWDLVPIMAVAALIGGNLGGRLSRIVNPTLLRRIVVGFGFAVAVRFWAA